MANPDAYTEQFTRLGEPAPEPRRFRVGVAGWVAVVLLGTGAGVTAQLLHDPRPEAPPRAPVGESGFVRGDVNADDRADLLVSTDTEIRAYTSTGVGFGPSGYVAESAEDVLRGDVDGDGRADLVAAIPAETSLDVVLRLAGSSGFESPRRFHVEGIGRGDRLVLGDVDGDGDDDLIGVGGAGAMVSRAENGQLGDAGQWADDIELGEDAVVVAGMFTDDDRADLLVVDGPDQGVHLDVFPSNGRSFGAPELWREIPAWFVANMRVVVGDFDGDGRTDLAELGRPEGGGSDLMMLRSRGVDFGPPQQWLRDGDLDWATTRVVAGDYDGDGLADVATLEAGTAGATDVLVYLSNGTAFRSVSTWLTGGWPGTPRPVGVGAGALGVR